MRNTRIFSFVAPFYTTKNELNAINLPRQGSGQTSGKKTQKARCLFRRRCLAQPCVWCGNRGCLRHFILKSSFILPRQARGNHRAKLKKRRYPQTTWRATAQAGNVMMAMLRSRGRSRVALQISTSLPPPLSPRSEKTCLFFPLIKFFVKTP